MTRTPLSVTTISSATDSSQFPPLAAAMSTMTLPGRIEATISAVMSSGAGRPGISAVVMMMSTSRACAAYSSAALRSKSSEVCLAYPSELASNSSSDRSTRRNSAPIDSTCSPTSGRASKARTTAPRLPAVPTAASPATPAPTTRTLAGGTLPAAVTWPVNRLPNSWAASMTARYPAMLAIELSTSRDCAREMRGTASMARTVMFRAASRATRSGSMAGLTRLARISPVTQAGDLRVGGRVDLQDEVAGPDLVAGGHPGTGLLVGGVREARAGAGTGLDHHVIAQAAQLLHRLRGGRDPSLTGARLGRDTDLLCGQLRLFTPSATSGPTRSRRGYRPSEPGHAGGPRDRGHIAGLQLLRG